MAYQTWSFGDIRSYKEMCERWPDFEHSDRWIKANSGEFIFTPRHIVENATPSDNRYCGEDSGIYFLIQDDVIIYVGQSQKIARRLFDHADPLRENTKTFSKYFIISVPHYFMNDIECYYIDNFKPALNCAKGRGSWRFLF